TVRNLPLGCQDTLAQALVYVPQDQSCVVAPNLAVSVGAFDDTPAGTCSPPVPLLLTNSGGGDLDIQSLALQGRFFFQQGFNQNAGPLTIPAFGSNNSLDIYFCPDVDTNATYNGQLVIISNDPNSPEFVPLSATELDEPEITTAPVDPGGTWNFPDTTSGTCSATQAFTISNTGGSPLTLTSVTSSDDVQFHITNPPPVPYVLQPGTSVPFDVEFCPGAVQNGITATLSIGHDGANTPSPVQITMTGNGI
ncbi:MAG TPA: choice-of-anchor D domain-containing protein, partial [Candidatus Sulfomarinibacteraceae bacterium]|nr:choice-of-anchor D domain-containing protein [Candidatus Sulfomarinibacteraceae bacterium]